MVGSLTMMLLAAVFGFLGVQERDATVRTMMVIAASINLGFAFVIAQLRYDGKEKKHEDR